MRRHFMSRALVVLAVSALILGSTDLAGAESAALVVKQSAQDFPATVERLKAAVEARGAKIVATVDHAGAARANGLELGPTTLLIFGNPKLGTPLMQGRQTAGLDLPLRVLVWQDAAGAVQVGYWPPSAIAAAHGIADRGEVVDKMTAALDAITSEATQP